MLNVIILSPHVHALDYGIGTYNRQLINAFLCTENVALHIVKIQPVPGKEFTIDWDHNKRVTYYNIPKPVVKSDPTENSFATGLHSKYNKNVALLLRPYLNDLRNTVLHVDFSSACDLAKTFKEAYNIPVVTVAHFAHWQLRLEGNKRRLSRIWEKWQTKKVLNRFERDLVAESLKERELYGISDRVIAVTQYMKTFISDHYAIDSSKISVVRNGISLDCHSRYSNLSKEKLKQQWNIDKNEKIIVFSGRINRHKGVDYLLNAFRAVLKKDSQCRLFVIGEGSFSSCLSQCRDIWAKVSFTGYLEFPIIEQLYSIADLGVVPSIYDNCPYVVLELMKYRVPIISSNAEGLTEILTDNHDCLYVPRLEDPEGNLSINQVKLAEAMLNILRNKELATRLRDQAWLALSSRHSVDSMAQKTMNIYKEAIIESNTLSRRTVG